MAAQAARAVAAAPGPAAAARGKRAGHDAADEAAADEASRQLVRSSAAVRADRAPPFEYSVLHASKALRKMSRDGASVPVHKKGRGQAKARYLVALPGHLAPVAGGEIGSIEKLDSPHPEMVLQWPAGRLRLRGTVVRPRAKCLTLLFNCCASPEE